MSIEPAGPVHIIGERINPSGKGALRRALLAGDMQPVVQEAQAQAAAGAAIIDVNVGGKGIDEPATLPLAVRAVAGAVDAPLCIDTRHPGALIAALAACPGRPLVNSISAEKKALDEILPIVAAHRLPVVALCMGPEGIPTTVEGRLREAERVLEAAVAAGIAETDVVFDPLVMTVGADDQAARIALETIQRLRQQFPGNLIAGGASNVSYGMPARAVLNATFLATAVFLGLNMPITDPTDMDLRFGVLSGQVFLGRDRRVRQYMQCYRVSGSSDRCLALS